MHDSPDRKSRPQARAPDVCPRLVTTPRAAAGDPLTSHERADRGRQLPGNLVAKLRAFATGTPAAVVLLSLPDPRNLTRVRRGDARVSMLCGDFEAAYDRCDLFDVAFYVDVHALRCAQFDV